MSLHRLLGLRAAADPGGLAHHAELDLSALPRARLEQGGATVRRRADAVSAIVFHPPGGGPR